MPGPPGAAAPAGAAAPPVPVGGDAIDSALARVEDLGGRPLAEHADAYESLHGALRDVLAELDDA